MTVNELLELIFMSLKENTTVPDFGATLDHHTESLGITFIKTQQSFFITAKKDEE